MHGWQDEEEIYDEWGYHHGYNVNVDFLLPTGIYIPMEIRRNAAMKEVKEVRLEVVDMLYTLFEVRLYFVLFLAAYIYCVISKSKSLLSFNPCKI